VKRARDFRESAWNILRGRYWWTVLAGLIASVLGGASARGFRYDFRVGSNDVPHMLQSWTNGQVDVEQIYSIVRPFTGILASLAGLMLFYSIAVFIVGSAMQLGYNRYNLSLYESTATPKIETLFSCFSYFGNALVLRLLMFLKILAWTLLFIIPGIVAAYRYSMAPYIMAENPTYTATEAIEESKRLMANNKWRLFCLQLSFIGWMLLASLTVIGVVFLLPYTEAANAAFYLDLTGRLPVSPYATPGTQSAPPAPTAPVAPAAPTLGEGESSSKELI
jgi:uncharacterized membrane protein